MHVAYERFQPVRHEFYRARQNTAEGSRCDLIAIDMKLDTESTADIGADYPDLVLIDPQVAGNHILLLPGCLMRCIDGQAFITRVPVGHSRPGFQRNPCMPAERKFRRYSRITGFGRRLIARSGLEGEIIRITGMYMVSVRSERCTRVGNSRKWLPVNGQHLDCIFRKGAGSRHNSDHRFTLPPHDIHRHRVLLWTAQRGYMCRAARPWGTHTCEVVPR